MFGSAADQNYYWKYGIYEGGATGTLAVSYRNMTIGATATSLDSPNIISFLPDSNTIGDGITNANELTLTGTAAADSLVTVLRRDDADRYDKCERNRRWSLTPPPWRTEIIASPPR